jgi:hypothetical protein
MMRAIEARENVVWSLRLMFAYPPQSEEASEYRRQLLDTWMAIANGQDAPIVDHGDYHRVGNTIYVRTGAAMRQALGDVSKTKQDRARLGLVP